MDKNIILLPTNDELDIIKNNFYIKNEKHSNISYKNKICLKPWGHEFLIFQNNKIGIWYLKINKGHKTSLHCHFNKDTLLICLKGSAKIELINKNIINLNVLCTLLLPHYKFHALSSFSDEVYLIEIEIYNNNTFFSDKDDLLRIDDMYKRKDNIYNSSVNIIEDNLDMYDYFYMTNSFNKKIHGIDLNVTEYNANTIDKININSTYSILLEGSILQDAKYIKEGSLINSFENIQLIDDKIVILTLNKIDHYADNKIIYDLEQLNIIVDNLNKKNKKIILSSGCFDIIHIGHINTLIEAKKLGDILMICLSCDEQIKCLKGDNRPINNYNDRINLFKTIMYVDYIILYNESNIIMEESLGNIMKIVNPFYWVKGSDYSIPEINKKHPYLKNIKLIDNIPNKSTTIIHKKITNNNT
jgi:rfaE bifunctional protein nucleotidyltransferase chain/domain